MSMSAWGLSLTMVNKGCERIAAKVFFGVRSGNRLDAPFLTLKKLFSQPFHNSFTNREWSVKIESVRREETWGISAVVVPKSGQLSPLNTSSDQFVCSRAPLWSAE